MLKYHEAVKKLNAAGIEAYHDHRDGAIVAVHGGREHHVASVTQNGEVSHNKHVHDFIKKHGTVKEGRLERFSSFEPVNETYHVAFKHPEHGLVKRFRVVGASSTASAKKVVASHLGLKNTRDVRSKLKKVRWEGFEMSGDTLNEKFGEGFYHMHHDEHSPVLKPGHKDPMDGVTAAQHATKHPDKKFAYHDGRGGWHDARPAKKKMLGGGSKNPQMIVTGKYGPNSHHVVDDRDETPAPTKKKWSLFSR